MDKEFCIWLRAEDKVQYMGKPPAKATYEQMISDGWKPEHEGEITVVFSRKAVQNKAE